MPFGFYADSLLLDGWDASHHHGRSAATGDTTRRKRCAAAFAQLENVLARPNIGPNLPALYARLPAYESGWTKLMRITDGV